MSQFTLLSHTAVLEVEACTMLEITLKERLAKTLEHLEEVKHNYHVQKDIRAELQHMAANMHNLTGFSIKRKLQELGDTQ